MTDSKRVCVFSRLGSAPRGGGKKAFHHFPLCSLPPSIVYSLLRLALARTHETVSARSLSRDTAVEKGAGEEASAAAVVGGVAGRLVFQTRGMTMMMMHRLLLTDGRTDGRTEGS